jgi:hypothetical protein
VEGEEEEKERREEEKREEEERQGNDEHDHTLYTNDVYSACPLSSLYRRRGTAPVARNGHRASTRTYPQQKTHEIHIKTIHFHFSLSPQYLLESFFFLTMCGIIEVLEGGG